MPFDYNVNSALAQLGPDAVPAGSVGSFFIEVGKDHKVDLREWVVIDGKLCPFLANVKQGIDLTKTPIYPGFTPIKCSEERKHQVPDLSAVQECKVEKSLAESLQRDAKREPREVKKEESDSDEDMEELSESEDPNSEDEDSGEFEEEAKVCKRPEVPRPGPGAGP